MKKNVGLKSRIIRVILGILALVVAITDFFADDFLDQVFLITGILLLFTAVFQYCPLYNFLGINTHVKKKKIKMY